MPRNFTGLEFRKLVTLAALTKNTDFTNEAEKIIIICPVYITSYSVAQPGFNHPPKLSLSNILSQSSFS